MFSLSGASQSVIPLNSLMLITKTVISQRVAETFRENLRLISIPAPEPTKIANKMRLDRYAKILISVPTSRISKSSVNRMAKLIRASFQYFLIDFILEQ